jgi:hypothetical protein
MTPGTITATVTMDYETNTVQIDKGDSMHPPESETTIRIGNIDIDGQDIPEPLRGMLIEFMRDKIT